MNADLLTHARRGAIVHQHRARRGGGLRGAGRGRPGERAARRPRRVRRTSRRRRRRLHDPILGLPGVYGTHHIGASTDQAQEAIAAETVRIVRTFVETGRVPNVVNLAKTDRRRRTCWSCGIATSPACWRMSSIALRDAGLNVQETENIIFEGAEAAVARINLDGEPPRR